MPTWLLDFISDPRTLILAEALGFKSVVVIILGQVACVAIFKLVSYKLQKAKIEKSKKAMELLGSANERLIKESKEQDIRNDTRFQKLSDKHSKDIDDWAGRIFKITDDLKNQG